MKTLIIYITDVVRFAILDGDYSRFHGLEINCEMAYEREFSKLCYDEEGTELIKFTEDKSLLDSKEWDKSAVVMFIY